MINISSSSSAVHPLTKVVFVQNILFFCCDNPVHPITYSHVNSAFRETLTEDETYGTASTIYRNNIMNERMDFLQGKGVRVPASELDTHDPDKTMSQTAIPPQASQYFLFHLCASTQSSVNSPSSLLWVVESLVRGLASHEGLRLCDFHNPINGDMKPLVAAVINGHNNIVRCLFQVGKADVNASTNNMLKGSKSDLVGHNLAVYHATLRGNAAVLKALTDRGATLFPFYASTRFHPLVLSVKAKSRACLKIILESEEFKRKFEMTEDGEPRLLLSCDDFAELTDKDDLDLIALCVKMNFFEGALLILQKSAEMDEMQLTGKIKVKDDDANKPRSKSLMIRNFLLPDRLEAFDHSGHGAHMHSSNKFPSLAFAISQGYLPLVKLLIRYSKLSHQNDVRLKGSPSYSIERYINYVIPEKHYSMLLLKNTQPQKGSSSIKTAAKSSNDDLQTEKNCISCLSLAMILEKPEMVEVLVSSGANPFSIVKGTGFNVLHQFCDAQFAQDRNPSFSFKLSVLKALMKQCLPADDDDEEKKKQKASALIEKLDIKSVYSAGNVAKGMTAIEISFRTVNALTRQLCVGQSAKKQQQAEVAAPSSKEEQKEKLGNVFCCLEFLVECRYGNQHRENFKKLLGQSEMQNLLKATRQNMDILKTNNDDAVIKDITEKFKKLVKV